MTVRGRRPGQRFTLILNWFVKEVTCLLVLCDQHLDFPSKICVSETGLCQVTPSFLRRKVKRRLKYFFDFFPSFGGHSYSARVRAVFESKAIFRRIEIGRAHV